MADARPVAGTRSDLPMRTATAIVMLVVSGAALWLGGFAWMLFVLAVGIGVWFEWSALCLLMYPPGGKRTVWRYGGAVYCGIACAVLLALRDMPGGLLTVLAIVGAVVATDIGAYAFGRTLGGPKIAPRISPSKTWAGLLGGIVGASVVIGATSRLAAAGAVELEGGLGADSNLLLTVVAGTSLAAVAQTGDFFESWMKRKAGVKDSGKLLPGHGGLFDRVDGLLLVLVVIGNILLLAQIGGRA